MYRAGAGWLVWLLGVVACGHAAAQTGLVVSRVGYSAPEPIAVAPGQIITLFVRAGGDTLTGRVVAGNPPLPTLLAGFSVTLLQSLVSDQVAVPLLSVDPVRSCLPVTPAECSKSFAVTVQIPFELVPNAPRTGMPENYAALRVARGDTNDLVRIDPKPDSIHIANSCDVSQQLPGGCYGIVTHPDGTVVTRLKPARAGETLTANVVGLGFPGILVKTGEASPESALVDRVVIGFDARPNGSPVAPADSEDGRIAPVLAAMLAGSVGMYQVSFVVPALPEGTPECDATVKSNLTVSIGRGSSFDGAGICVQR